jgi:hypothetical protein
LLRIQPQYLALCQERSFRLPERYLDFADHTTAIEDALGARPVATVPCNNDLLAANFIDDGDKVWLIDYEYSGNNDPFFEIGNVWSEAAGTPDDLERLVSAYVGHPSTALTARARLWGLMSKYGWMLWASIQDGTSALDFDFWSWGLEKYDRAVPEFDGPDFGRLLEERREQLLAELGYKQELNRSWSGFSNFAISFSIISILAGCFTTFGLGWNNGGPARSPGAGRSSRRSSCSSASACRSWSRRSRRRAASTGGPQARRRSRPATTPAGSTSSACSRSWPRWPTAARPSST